MDTEEKEKQIAMKILARSVEQNFSSLQTGKSRQEVDRIGLKTESKHDVHTIEKMTAYRLATTTKVNWL